MGKRVVGLIVGMSIAAGAAFAMRMDLRRRYGGRAFRPVFARSWRLLINPGIVRRTS